MNSVFSFSPQRDREFLQYKDGKRSSSRIIQIKIGWNVNYVFHGHLQVKCLNGIRALIPLWAADEDDIKGIGGIGALKTFR